MALSVTSIATDGAAGCSDHKVLTINDEGTTRTFKVTQTEVMERFDSLSRADAVKLLCLLWIRYRQLAGRTTSAVNIA